MELSDYREQIDAIDQALVTLYLRRMEVVDRIAEQVVRGNLLEGDHVLIDVDAEGRYTCQVEKPLDFDMADLADL